MIWFVCAFLIIENTLLAYKYRIKIKNIAKKLFKSYNQRNISRVTFIDEEGAWYSMDNKPLLILHGGGGTSYKYSNSKEGISEGIKKGYKIIEIDIGMTLDNELVLTHRFKPDNEILFDTRPTLEQFLAKGAPEGETALSLRLFFEEFKDAPVFFLIDCAHGIEYKVCVWIRDNIEESKRKNLIFQVHTQNMLKGIARMQVFNNIHYNGDCIDIYESLALLKENNVHTCSIADEELLATNEVLKDIVDKGIHVIGYTVNHKRRLDSIVKLGVSGVFTDCLLPNDTY